MTSAPAAAIAPKVSADSVQLAAPIFDHSKIAIIDAITRLGLPPANPFFGEYGELGQLAYYYLYYVSAAQASIALGVSGWEADIALTWFAAFSSLTLMMGIAVWLAKRSGAAILAVALACGTSLRELLWMLFGAERLSAILAEATLSFLGLGVKPTTPTWGLIVSDATRFTMMYNFNPDAAPTLTVNVRRLALVRPPLLTTPAPGVVSWLGTSNLSYRVQASTNLTTWVERGVATSPTDTFSYTNPVTVSQEFLRVAYP
jgi:hypothetical protein